MLSATWAVLPPSSSFCCELLPLLHCGRKGPCIC